MERIEYEYMYFDTLKEDHVDPKKPLCLENQSLDFSFCDLTDVVSLKKKEPRAGKRKQIIDSDNEEEKKQDPNKSPAKVEDLKVDEEKEKENKGDYAGEGQKKTTVKTSHHTPAVNSVLQTNNISLINNTDRGGPRIGNMDMIPLGASGKAGEETKNEGTRKKVVKKVCRTLLLNNNEIRTIDRLLPTLEMVMNFPSKLKWLDLSFNYLTKIEEDILSFPELKTLYLHGNYIYQLDEVKKLAELPELISLTLHGNPIEQISGYRLYVLGIIYSRNEKLRKLDSVVITRKEQEACYVWNEHLHKRKTRFPQLEDSKIKKPPQKDEEQKNGDKKNTNTADN